MKLSLIAIALWAANSVLNVVLVAVLFLKRRARVVPWFTAWMSYDLLYAAGCFLVYRLGSKESYRLVYWIGALGDFLLQLAVLGEIADHVLKRNGRWVAGAKSAVLPLVIAGPIAAGLLAGPPGNSILRYVFCTLPPMIQAWAPIGVPEARMRCTRTGVNPERQKCGYSPNPGSAPSCASTHEACPSQTRLTPRLSAQSSHELCDCASPGPAVARPGPRQRRRSRPPPSRTGWRGKQAH